MALDLAIIRCSSGRVGLGYPVLVHRAAALLDASSRPRLATTPLRLANPSPPSGWIEDFHLQAVVHARHTPKYPLLLPPGVPADARRRPCSQDARGGRRSPSTHRRSL